LLRFNVSYIKCGSRYFFLVSFMPYFDDSHFVVLIYHYSILYSRYIFGNHVVQIPIRRYSIHGYVYNIEQCVHVGVSIGYRYRYFTLGLTFFIYCSYHASRKAISVVKVRLFTISILINVKSQNFMMLKLDDVRIAKYKNYWF